MCSFLLGALSVVFPDGALAGLIFFGIIALIFGACVYFVTKRTSIAVLVAAVPSVVCTVLFFAFPYSLENSTEWFLKFVSPFRHFAPTVFRFFDIAAVLFYVSFAALFLWIAYIALKSQDRVKVRPRAPMSSKRATVCVSVVATFLCFNIAVCSLPKAATSFDLTKNRIYSVSDDTKEYLKGLDEDITVYLIDFVGSEEIVNSYIRRYCELSKRIKVKEVDTSKDTELVRELGISSSVSMYSVLVKSEKRSKLVSSEEYFTYYHPELDFLSPSELQNYLTYYSQLLNQYSQTEGASYETLSQIQSIYESLATESVLYFKPEAALGYAIEYVTADYIPTMYFLSGHGEKNTSTNPLNIKEISDIPEDAGLILINCPTEDYSDTEIQKLLKYSDNGGRLLVLSNPDNLVMPNFNRLMSALGLYADENVISENESSTLTVYPNSQVISTGVSQIKLTDTNVLSANGEIIAYPLLTTQITKQPESEEAEEQTETATVGMMVYRNNNPSAIWITGGESFNADYYSMSETEQSEYLSLMSVLQVSSAGLMRGFESSNYYPDPKAYSEELLETEDVDVSKMSALFIFVAPLLLAGIPLLNIYVRKRKSRAVIINE